MHRPTRTALSVEILTVPNPAFTIWSLSRELTGLAGSADVSTWPELVAVLRMTGLAVARMLPGRGVPAYRLTARQEGKLVGMAEWYLVPGTVRYAPVMAWTLADVQQNVTCHSG